MPNDYAWWDENARANQRKVKTLLTRAEKIVNTDPARALQVAEDVEAIFEEHGWPDWWSRVERLKQDALFARRRIDGSF
jgi:hypothetical protein